MFTAFLFHFFNGNVVHSVYNNIAAKILHIVKVCQQGKVTVIEFEASFAVRTFGVNNIQVNKMV
jgi:hypothetical protein